MTDLLQGFLSGSAAWGVLLTLAAFALGALINKTTGKAIFNPLLLGSIFVIILLSVLNISYADYKVSAAPVNYLLLPGRSLFLCDTHVNENPDADQIAEITLMAAESVRSAP